MFLTSNHCFWLKDESSNHNIVFFSEKSSSESEELYAQIKHCLQAETVQNRSKQLDLSISMWEDNRRWTFSLEEVLVIHRMTRILARRSKIKWSIEHTAFGFKRCLLMDWSGVDYLWIIVMFSSAVWTLVLTRHPFTAEDPLVSKWNATYLQIWWRNKLIYIFRALRVGTFSENFKLCNN